MYVVLQLEDAGSKKFLVNLRFLQHIIHEELPNFRELDDVLELLHLNAKFFINMRKNHSRSTFSGNETGLFDNMLRFSDGDSSTSSSSSSSSFDGDGDENVEEDNQNAAWQQVVEGLTTLGEKETEDEIHVTEDADINAHAIHNEEDLLSTDDVVDHDYNDDADYGLSQAIMVEQDDEPSSKSKISKELEEELSRKAIEDILSQDYHDEVNAQIQLENTMAETTASYVITPKETGETPKTVPEVHAKTPKSVTTPSRKKSIAKRTFKRSEDVITPDPTKYKILYDTIDTEELDDRCVEKMVYLFEHGIQKGVDNKFLGMKKKLKATREENEKVRNLNREKVVKRGREWEMSKDDTQAQLDYNKNLALLNEKVLKLKEINRELDKKRVADVSRSGIVESFDIGIENFSKETLREKIVSWRYDIYKDMYVIFRTRGKKQFFKNGEDIFKFPVSDLKESSRIKMNSILPKGYGFENYLRRMERDGFKGI
ncbi:hypothetical protein L1987_13316 [Smallanthus sonchifolius]|uniref:Uncharacterized protein n=1 Tax=Smallanthus sonchifolius TaxID=185202 RepID=A0ACB9JJP5_9ASTR|nr:hypothetical protein L1987_13316 [Smallanthus sonchifolius]